MSELANVKRECERLALAADALLSLRGVQPGSPVLSPPLGVGDCLAFDAGAASRMIVQSELRPRRRASWPVSFENA